MEPEPEPQERIFIPPDFIVLSRENFYKILYLIRRDILMKKKASSNGFLQKKNHLLQEIILNQPC